MGQKSRVIPILYFRSVFGRYFSGISREAEDCHVMLALKGHFKGEVDERWHLVPVSDYTRSGLLFRLWMERALHRRVNLQNQTTGRVFQNRRGVRSKLGIKGVALKAPAWSCGDWRFQSMEITKARGCLGDYKPGCCGEDDWIDQPLVQEGGSWYGASQCGSKMS